MVTIHFIWIIRIRLKRNRYPIQIQQFPNIWPDWTPKSGSCTPLLRAPLVLTWRYDNQSAGKPQNQILPDFLYLEAYDLDILARCGEKFHRLVHGNIIYQILPKNPIWWFSCQVTFKQVGVQNLKIILLVGNGNKLVNNFACWLSHMKQ